MRYACARQVRRGAPRVAAARGRLGAADLNEHEEVLRTGVPLNAYVRYGMCVTQKRDFLGALQNLGHLSVSLATTHERISATSASAIARSNVGAREIIDTVQL